MSIAQDVQDDHRRVVALEQWRKETEATLAPIVYPADGLHAKLIEAAAWIEDSPDPISWTVTVKLDGINIRQRWFVGSILVEQNYFVHWHDVLGSALGLMPALKCLDDRRTSHTATNS